MPRPLLCWAHSWSPSLAAARPDSKTVEEVPQGPAEKLSQYGLFLGNGSTQEPAEGVIPYELNSALFTDYAAKYRFVKLPGGNPCRVQRQRGLRLPGRHRDRQDVRLSPRRARSLEGPAA